MIHVAALGLCRIRPKLTRDCKDGLSMRLLTGIYGTQMPIQPYIHVLKHLYMSFLIFS
ncbi:hypothetical protein PENSPDRAFT_86631 [Peniophora sp. CONT]|nr:hypothetical protein PENSPDRAFT_219488 [Peniophora sp. CONT]KZV66459.1 hypothetical protein PENSPDRAFT_86631 [Peniophora sp. CONT]